MISRAFLFPLYLLPARSSLTERRLPWGELLPSSCSTVVIMFVPEWKLKSYSGFCASDLWDHLWQVKTQLIM